MASSSPQPTARAPAPLAPAAPYVLPTIAATTPTVHDSITYGIWAVVTAIILNPSDFDSNGNPGGVADPNGPHTPLTLSALCIKGRVHPDGYFEASPVDPPVGFGYNDVIATAQGNAQLQTLLNSTVTAIGNAGKARGLL